MVTHCCIPSILVSDFPIQGEGRVSDGRIDKISLSKELSELYLQLWGEKDTVLQHKSHRNSGRRPTPAEDGKWGASGLGPGRRE